jgi:hypothetical protein
VFDFAKAQNAIDHEDDELYGYAFNSNSRLVEKRSDSGAKEQLASLAFRSDSMLAVDRCSLVFSEGRVFN